MERVFVTQIKSFWDCTIAEREALLKLGLGRIGKTKEFDDTPAKRVALRKARFVVKTRCR